VPTRFVVSGSPLRIDCEAIIVVECKVEKRMGLRYTAVQQTHCWAWLFRSLHPSTKIINPNVLFTANGSCEEGWSVARISKLLDSTAIENELLKLDDICKYRNDLYFGKNESSGTNV
jgi:hypothetical protein